MLLKVFAEALFQAENEIYMLEPVAAVIFNTVLCGRSTLEQTVPLRSVSKIVKSPPSRPLAASFFNPQPRYGEQKGKERALDETGHTAEPFVTWTYHSGRAAFPSDSELTAGFL